jgi:o-succinylbenzoate synthase
MFQVSWERHLLHFKFEAGTSRGVLTQKNTWFVFIQKGNVIGKGEAAPLEKLSIDDVPNFEEQLAYYTALWQNWLNSDTARQQLQLIQETPDAIAKLSILSIPLYQIVPTHFPTIRFAFETATLDYLNGGKGIILQNDFSLRKKALPINGLVWMGTFEKMQAQIEEKLQAGFNCIKMKVGAIDFEQEIRLIENLRKHYAPQIITLRVDANGAFSDADVMEKLNRLSALGVHSIEQPIQVGQVETMAKLCKNTPLPIALDEELIGVHQLSDKIQLLQRIKPQYVILKPSLLGGLYATAEWISAAENNDIGWWITSALEANVGLNAICQFTACYPITLPQGLGTGQLFENNIPSDLCVEKGTIFLKNE